MTSELNPREDETVGAAKAVTTSVVDPYLEEPMEGRGALATLEALLKRPGRVLHGLRGRKVGGVVVPLTLIAMVCLTVYGVVAGSMSGGDQLWAAPAKIVLGTFVSSLICLPSLYVFLCLGGVDTRLKELMGSLAAMVALASVMLVGLAPVAWVFSQSTDSVALMTVLHLVFWAVAVVLGAQLLGRFLSGLGRKVRLGGWLAIYLLVCLQMMTTLRPIVGRADTFLPTEKRFFLQHFFGLLDGDGRGKSEG